MKHAKIITGVLKGTVVEIVREWSGPHGKYVDVLLPNDPEPLTYHTYELAPISGEPT